MKGAITFGISEYAVVVAAIFASCGMSRHLKPKWVENRQPQ
jgi:hypothetical protein